MTRRSWLGAALVVLVLSAVWLKSRWLSTAGERPADRGGTLVALLHSEPATFNWYTDNGYPTHLIATLTQARLVRINRVTQDVEPWLSDRWISTADGLRFTLHLREGLRFSDGRPFGASDVLFSFEAVYDPRTASPIADALMIGGKPLTVRATSKSEVEITFPEPYGPGIRILDNLPIYPRHRLDAFQRSGTFARAWGPTTPPAEMAGLGPFVLASYDPGQRLVFTRNRHYWRTDTDGTSLPRLDRLVLEIVPDQNAELLRLGAGEADLLQNELRPEDYVLVKQQAAAGRVQLQDVGTSLDTYLLWFNLGPAAQADRARPWRTREELRLAISSAVDRNAFVRAVYLGAAEPAWGPVSPANTKWYAADVPRLDYNPARARTLLASIGLEDRNGDGRLEDATGTTARFTVLIEKGVTAAEKGAAVLRHELARVGLEAEVVSLDGATIVDRWARGAYDAIYYWLIASDSDPAGNLDFWLSSGRGHMWHPGQARPAAEWERRIDELMRRQSSAIRLDERRRLFADTQRVVAEHAPVVAFAVPHVYVATSARLGGGTPAVQRPQLLWNPDTLFVKDPSGTR
jgi:peptide/nickel transport system substrate-binding protein